MKKLTKAWIRKAEDDLLAAEALVHGAVQLHDQVCFHCQQATEKFLKAIMQEQGVNIPRIHDLDELLDLVVTSQPSLRRLRRGMSFLTTFAVETRYPGDDATKRQAEAALRWARRTREAVRLLLGF
jgi:HEPN domain-containing protein